MRIEPAKPADIVHVAAHMREADLKEFLALSPANDRAALALELSQRFGQRNDVFAAWHEEMPIAIGATIEARPNVLTLLFFASDGFRHIGRELTKFMKQRYFPPLIEAGVHRIECVSMEGHKEAHRWIKALGLVQEGGPLRGYGKNGETYFQYAWVRDDLRTPGT